MLLKVAELPTEEKSGVWREDGAITTLSQLFPCQMASVGVDGGACPCS